MLPNQSVYRKTLCSVLASGALCFVWSGQVVAQQADGNARYSYGLYGTPGLIDMPTAQSAQDAELASTLSYFGGTTRTTLTFQIAPRLSGSFRYSNIDRYFPTSGDDLYDRSFDLRYRLLDEGRYRPSVAIGLQDFIGTGIYSAEYLVATKHLSPAVSVTGGIGWGRLGSADGFDNPLAVFGDTFADRPSGFTGTGGQIESARWFRGDAALFGGVAWQATDSLRLLAEYSSDAYSQEAGEFRDVFNRKSPLNLGASYQFANGTALQAYTLYGTEVGASVTFQLNPREPLVNGGATQRPTPVAPRDAGAAANRDWIAQADAPEILQGSMQRFLAFEGITLEAMSLQPTQVTVLIRNETYVTGSEAVGRTARILTNVMPASVETFRIIPVVGGVRAAEITIRRSDMENLEFADNNVALSRQRAAVTDAHDAGRGVVLDDGLYPRLQWRLGPYLSASYFDPDSPVRADLGLELAGTYDAAPGLQFSGALRKRLGGNIGEGRASNSVIQRVRSDGPIYAAEGDPAIKSLTASYQTNLAPNFYGRVTAGYLETMFGGVSTEVLWKPAPSALGLGLELNYVRQRDFDQLFGFQDYDVLTSHASAYYAFENNFHGQIDVGRYLGGDFGATIALDREFDNGWRIGAFATLTDVSFDDFGEGSFDKGLRFSIPLEHFLGTASARVNSVTLRPLSRDGGARLDVNGRLYEAVRGYHDNDLSGNWARFWR